MENGRSGLPPPDLSFSLCAAPKTKARQRQRRGSLDEGHLPAFQVQALPPAAGLSLLGDADLGAEAGGDLDGCGIGIAASQVYAGVVGGGYGGRRGRGERGAA